MSTATSEHTTHTDTTTLVAMMKSSLDELIPAVSA